MASSGLPGGLQSADLLNRFADLLRDEQGLPPNVVADVLATLARATVDPTAAI
jgi:hypothetical protein